MRLKDEFAINVRKHRIQLQRSKDSSDVEARYSKSMSKEREGWSREFKGMMSKCEDDAVKLRQQHDQNMVLSLLLSLVFIPTFSLSHRHTH